MGVCYKWVNRGGFIRFEGELAIEWSCQGLVRICKLVKLLGQSVVLSLTQESIGPLVLSWNPGI